jgi:hypothetical protein
VLVVIISSVRGGGRERREAAAGAGLRARRPRPVRGTTCRASCPVRYALNSNNLNGFAQPYVDQLPPRPTEDVGRADTRLTSHPGSVPRPDPTYNALCCPSGMRRNHGIGPMPHVSTPTGTPRGGACHPPFAILPPPVGIAVPRTRSQCTQVHRLYRVTAYTSHLYRQPHTKAPLFVGRQCALSMTVHHACLHEHRVSTPACHPVHAHAPRRTPFGLCELLQPSRRDLASSREISPRRS